jgi:acyl carrier protein
MKDEAQVRDCLMGLINKMVKKPAIYRPGADIFADFGLDSLDQIEFLFNVEEQFGLKIEDETFEEKGLRNFDRLVTHLAEGGSGSA